MFVSKNMFNNKFIDLHLCFTNFKRKNINNIMMRKVVQNSNVQPLMLKALDYDDNSQDVFLLPNMPVICGRQITSSTLLIIKV